MQRAILATLLFFFFLTNFAQPKVKSILSFSKVVDFNIKDSIFTPSKYFSGYSDFPVIELYNLKGILVQKQYMNDLLEKPYMKEYYNSKGEIRKCEVLRPNESLYDYHKYKYDRNSNLIYDISVQNEPRYSYERMYKYDKLNRLIYKSTTINDRLSRYITIERDTFISKEGTKYFQEEYRTFQIEDNLDTILIESEHYINYYKGGEIILEAFPNPEKAFQVLGYKYSYFEKGPAKGLLKEKRCVDRSGQDCNDPWVYLYEFDKYGRVTTKIELIPETEEMKIGEKWTYLYEYWE